MELQACSFWISAFSSAEASLYHREVGEREKESARGAMGRGGDKERHPPFPLPIIPRTLTFLKFFFQFESQRWPIWIREGQANALRPGYPNIKERRMLFVKFSMYVWLVKFMFYAGNRYQRYHKMFKTNSKENQYGWIWLRVICVADFFRLLESPESLQMLRLRLQEIL